jgi:hypothetical protein
VEEIKGTQQGNFLIFEEGIPSLTVLYFLGLQSYSPYKMNAVALGSSTLGIMFMSQYGGL